MRVKEVPFGAVGLALNEREGEVAAKDHAAGFADPFGEACSDRTDSGNRQDAKRNASDEHAKAAQTAAQIAPGKSPSKSPSKADGPSSG
jgi:hypothetical protein